MKCIILAAGYATRLYPLTENLPKPLIEVGGKPIIDHILEKVESLEEVDEVFVVTNDKFYKNFLDWASKYQCGKKISVINDGTTSNEKRLGSIGDIHFTIVNKGICEDILVIGGDNLFDFSLRPFVEGYNKHKKTFICLYDVGDLELAKQFGIAELDNDERVISFIEKPESPKSTLSSTCIYLYPSSVLGYFEEYMIKLEKVDKSGHLLERLCALDEVYGYLPQGNWFDIGTFEQLESARQEFNKKLEVESISKS